MLKKRVEIIEILLFSGNYLLMGRISSTKKNPIIKSPAIKYVLYFCEMVTFCQPSKVDQTGNIPYSEAIGKGSMGDKRLYVLFF